MSVEKQLDKEEIKRLCSGRWSDIVMVLAPMLAGALSKERKAQPCPKCGGTDRFNFDKDFYRKIKIMTRISNSVYKNKVLNPFFF